MNIDFISFNGILGCQDVKLLHYQDKIEGGYGFLLDSESTCLNINQAVVTIIYNSDRPIDNFLVKDGIFLAKNNHLCFLVDTYEQIINS